MNFIVDIFLAIVSILLVIFVMLQGSKDDINDAFNGSKSELFKNQKTRGVELFMVRATAILAIVFIALVITSLAIHSQR